MSERIGAEKAERRREKMDCETDRVLAGQKQIC